MEKLKRVNDFIEILKNMIISVVRFLKKCKFV